MADLKECSQEEFDAFVRAYPRKLVRDVFGACEPPLVTYNDFTIAPNWPESVVASYSAGDAPKAQTPYYGPPSNFKIQNQ